MWCDYTLVKSFVGLALWDTQYISLPNLAILHMGMLKQDQEIWGFKKEEGEVRDFWEMVGLRGEPLLQSSTGGNVSSSSAKQAVFTLRKALD